MEATTARTTPTRRELLPPAAAAAVVIATIAFGLTAGALGIELGVALPPFLGDWRPRAVALAVPVAALLAAAVVLAPRLLSPSLGAARFAAAALALGLGLRVGLAVAAEGPRGLWEMFELGNSGAASEYLPALPALDLGTRFFLDTFAELGPSLTVNAVGHPPGLLVTLHLLGIESARGMAAFLIATGALSVPLAYLVARQLLDERRARAATLLYAFAPSAVLLGATSADALYATLALAALLPLIAGRLALGAAAFAFAAFFSYANLAIGAFAALVVARRDGLRAALVLAAACALGLAASLGLLHFVTGYDPVGALRSAESVYREGVASTRPYAFWAFGAPTAFLVGLGPVTAWFALRAAGAGDVPAQALLAVIVVSVALGFTKAETERIWLFLVPLACIAAAAVLPAHRVPVALAILAAQALAVELLFGTVW
jgi:methylthioxylose transferase